jgi:outer membrane protein assembly factor BamB
MSPQEPKRRRRRILLALGLALVLVVGAAAAFVSTRGGDVSNPNVEFRPDTATPTPEQEPQAPGSKDPADGFIWAQYGYSKDRRRYLPTPAALRPPFKELWQYQGHVLLEFPPVMGGKRLYILNDHGVLLSLDKHTGKVRWRRKLGALAAASPAYDRGTVYVVLLQRGLHGGAAHSGRAVALDGKTGKIVWSRSLASRSESSPLVADGRVYFGSENGTVYALATANGNVRWRYRASGAVKGGVALDSGKLYFGAYGGRMHAIRERDGALVWRSSTHGRRFGLGSGNFYATPAVAYGRVYLGNTDGKVYSFSATSGKLAWTHSTGGYVYASPAVAQVPGGRPTVYIGSYSGRFYALDARSGSVRWSRGGNGKISGGATVIGDIVYYADLGKRRTIGLGARTGRKVYEHARGSYNPVISDGETLFLTGYHALYALQPLSAAARAKRVATARKQARTRKARRQATHDFCLRQARHSHRGHKRSISRSYHRCRDRAARRAAHRAAARRKAARRACLRQAKRLHHGNRGRVSRSYRRCVAKHHARRR